MTLNITYLRKILDVLFFKKFQYIQQLNYILKLKRAKPNLPFNPNCDTALE